MLILICFYFILCCVLIYWLHAAESFLRNWFPASQEILPFYGTQSFITAFTSACHLSLSWAHTSGSIQVWGTRLYFVTGYVFTVRSCSHLTQPLSWSTTPCGLSVTIYSIYSHLPSMLEGRCYIGCIAFYDGFIVTNVSEGVLSVCIINTTAFFLPDMFHS